MSKMAEMAQTIEELRTAAASINAAADWLYQHFSGENDSKQERIIRDLFGVLKPNGYRQFNTAYIEIPKKMGKSELAAAVALLLCCGDGEERAEVYGCAADRQQATIVFDVAADMVRMCPALNRRVKILASQKRIIYEPTNSFYQVLSAEAYSKHGFNRMIDECMSGNIDMIITKSISRFARNTLDCLQYIRQLKDKNIPVYFEKESINTLDAKGEVLLTIMASLAQQESQSMSENIKLGLQYRYQQGKVQVNHNRFLGYTKDENGNLVIDPEQAEIVKRIYREYLEGSSMDKIASGLMADGILTGAGKEKWHTSTINKILRNEKYMGDALLQKTYTTDFLTKKRIKNNGTVPQYYVEGDHEAIIPKDLFMQVQAELVRRRAVHISPTGKKRGFSCNHCFAQMIFCGDCGELYRRVHWNNHGCKSIVWRCISRLEPGSADTNCTNRTVNELLLQEVTVNAINQILTERGTFLKQLQANIAKAVVSADTLSPDGIQARLEELQKELIKKANNKQDYDAIADEILRLREQKEQSEVDSHHREETMNRIKELQDFISKQKTDITEFDEALVKKLIEKITVFADHFTVEFKSGLVIDIEA